MVLSVNYLEATVLEDVATPSTLRDFLDGVAVGITIGTLIMMC